ncbi:hybrid sensor histidine kinase/response regulator [Cohnella nanjingensis]|uniref:Circadian input-output histidine kinase CikA n=1 Tax=Cohnella nanjingensis TaxID=1387779 RepID=A0A7X0RLC0_9BACL|nr:ATP-binding protein [Cohnella nanjingensis]MBB6669612.1 response regulator [Cohnella nanjingensis]
MLRKKWIGRTALLGIVLAFLAMLTMPVIGLTPEKFKPRAKDGVLDLRQWRLGEQGTIPLNGDWSLHGEQLLTAIRPGGQGDSQTEAFAEVPGVWTSRGMPGRGYATYHLKVLTSGETGRLGLHIPAIAPAYKLILDGHVIAQAGTVSADPAQTRNAYRPQTVLFDPPAGAFDLILQVANDLYPEGGIWYSMTLGTERQMLALQERQMMVDMAVFGGCVLLGLYQIAVFLLRHSERSTLYFGICCLLGAIRQWAVGGIYLVDVFPQTDIRTLILLEYLSYYGGVTMALLFVRSLYPKEYSGALIKLFAGIGCGFIATVLIFPAETYTRFMGAYKIVSLICLGYMIYGFLLALWRKRSGALLQLAGWLVFVAAAVHDIVYSEGRIIGIDFQLVPYGFILLVFIEALELARRFTSAYRVIGTMSDELVALNRMKDEFLANTSHELKTPLHGILNLSAALSEGKSGPVNETQREQLEVVVAVARRLSNLINDILDFSRLKNKGIQLQRRPVDIRALVAAQQEVFRHYIGQKPVALRMAWPESLPLADADPSRLLQVLYNLIGNAVKFTPQGEITVSAAAAGGMLRISVADTGIGISADKLETIFLSFEQAGTSVAREYGGTGLGLGISRQLVELHGGRLTVQSKVGQGAVFTFTLPASQESVLAPARYRPDAEEAAQARLPAGWREVAAARVPDRRDKPGQKILAVDDDPVNLRVVMAALSDEPYEVLAATSGAEALEMLDKSGGGIGLVILDVMMPGMSGYETCRQIRGKYPLSEMPVLLTTVRNEPEDLIYGFESGANDFLTKPFQPHELRARARTLLEMKRSAEDAVRSETAFLQAQIKPHFLYNTLNTIVSFSLDEPQTAHDLLLHLSRYLRNSFDFKNKEKLVPLRKELELTEAYLKIEQARFGKRLQVRFELDEGADCYLPPVTLQPLVENAVRHGVTKKEDGGTVSVTIRALADAVAICVEDDGAGMPAPAETILSAKREDGGGVGLQNIHQRLVRLYGKGLLIESEAGGGTRVTFRIPTAATHQTGGQA